MFRRSHGFMNADLWPSVAGRRPVRFVVDPALSSRRLKSEVAPFSQRDDFASEPLAFFVWKGAMRRRVGKVTLRSTWLQATPVHVCLLCQSPGVLLKQVLTVMQIFTSPSEVDLFVMLMWPARAKPCILGSFLSVYPWLHADAL